MQSFFYKYRVLVSFFILVLIGIGIFIFSFKQKSTPSKVAPVPTAINTEETVLPIPQPEFSEWIESEKLIFAKATPKENSSRYIFKTDFRPEEITRLSTIFNTKEEHSQSGSYHLYTKLDDSASVLLINSTNGEISYASSQGIPLIKELDKSNILPIEDKIYTFIKNIGLFDDSLRITSTYKKKGNVDVTYYELHRDWEVIGYPILNPIGILNIEEDNLLHEVSYFFKNLISIDDTNIVETSDQKDGYARNNDFNTITIAVNQKTGNVTFLNSNIRPLLLNTAYSSTQLLTRDEAFQQLKNGDINFFISKPSGNGNVALSKVYKDNKAIADKAIIQEEILVYLEKPSEITQESLEPYYLFRGYSELKSGYRVTFYAAISAIKGLTSNSLAFKNNVSSVAGVMAQNDTDPSQKQGTLDFPTAAPTPTLTITPVPSETQITTTINPTSRPVTTTVVPTEYISPTILPHWCMASPSKLTNTQQFEGLTFGKIDNEWYFVLDPNKSNETLLAKFDEFMNKVGRFMATQKRDFADEDFVKQQIMGLLSNKNLDKECPIRVSGLSPSLFLYTTINQNYEVSVDRSILYSDPQMKDGKWHITSQDKTLVINNMERSYLYYEYAPVMYEEPNKGWVINIKDLSTFSQKLGKKLALTQQEQNRLYDEMIIALGNSKQNYIFIGIIPENEINKKIPLDISPQIKNIQRIHLYLKPASQFIKVEQPAVNPLLRSEEMVVELGAILIK